MVAMYMYYYVTSVLLQWSCNCTGSFVSTRIGQRAGQLQWQTLELHDPLQAGKKERIIIIYICLMLYWRVWTSYARAFSTLSKNGFWCRLGMHMILISLISLVTSTCNIKHAWASVLLHPQVTLNMREQWNLMHLAVAMHMYRVL